MTSFDEIWEAAVLKKGSDAALEALLPKPIADKDLIAISEDRWLSDMTMRIFQAGFSWKVVEAKWAGFETVFQNFDPGPLAFMTDEDIGRLVSDKRIIRNGQKIKTVRENASFLLDIVREHGSVGAFYAGWPSHDFIGLLDVLKSRASRMGGASAQYHLRMMGKDAFLLSADVTSALIHYGVVDKAPTSKGALKATQAAFNQWMEESGRGLSAISRTLAATI